MNRDDMAFLCLRNDFRDELAQRVWWDIEQRPFNEIVACYQDIQGLGLNMRLQLTAAVFDDVKHPGKWD